MSENFMRAILVLLVASLAVTVSRNASANCLKEPAQNLERRTRIMFLKPFVFENGSYSSLIRHEKNSCIVELRSDVRPFPGRNHEFQLYRFANVDSVDVIHGPRKTRLLRFNLRDEAFATFTCVTKKRKPTIKDLLDATAGIAAVNLLECAE